MRSRQNHLDRDVMLSLHLRRILFNQQEYFRSVGWYLNEEPYENIFYPLIVIRSKNIRFDLDRFDNPLMYDFMWVRETGVLILQTFEAIL